ncbi:MAG: NosD domain-containing protein [Promethearchaeota archaeon]
MSRTKLFIGFILVIFIFFQGSSFIIPLNIPNLNNSTIDYNNQNSKQLKSSGYWILPPILIDGGLNGMTWEEAALEPWCSGNGTWNNPYIIENVSISTDQRCLAIHLSKAFFIIRNCTFKDAANGIYLYYTTNGTITNNTFSNHTQGIHIEFECKNITISENVLNNNGHGIYTWGGHSSNRIKNNTITNSIASGITFNGAGNYCNITNNKLIECCQVPGSMSAGMRFHQSSNNIIKDNLIVNSSDEGIDCTGTNNKILNNTIIGSGTHGIYGVGDFYIIENNSIVNSGGDSISLLNSDNSKISNNTCVYNGGNGLFMETSDFNNVTKNSFTDCTENGIYVKAGNFNMCWENIIKNNIMYGVKLDYWIYPHQRGVNNTFYNNSFINNSENVLDYGSQYTSVNYWNYSKIGNFWDDYSGVDENDDGIGDTSYVISTQFGDLFVYDYWPIWDDGPTIIVKSPQNSEVYRDPPSFIVESTDPELDLMWYTVNQTNKKFFIYDNGSIDYDTWNDLAEGIVNIRFYGNDTAGNVNFKDIFIIKDNSSPSITIFTPFNGTIIGKNAPTFNVSITDVALNLTWYTLNGGQTKYIISNFIGAINQSAWESVSEGIVEIVFYANDSFGSLSFETLYLIKDVTSPIIKIIYPTQEIVMNISAPNFIVEIFDLHSIQEMWYSIDGGLTNTSFTGNQSISQDLWDAISDGIVIITFYANDTAGNLNSTSVSIVKDSISPSITILSPSNNDIYGIAPPKFELLIDDANLKLTWYTIEGIQEIFYFSGFNGTIDENLWDMLEEGNIKLTFYANDAAGNVASISVSIIKKLPTEKIPLVTIIIATASTVGGIGVATFIIVVLRKRKRAS